MLLKYKYWKELRCKNKEQLENEVFNFEDDYFSFIGFDKIEVKEFKKFIDAKNVIGLRNNWKRLSSKFIDYEREGGHEGRPLILDYYCWYEMTIKELYKRIN